MILMKRLFSVPTWLRMRLAGTKVANLYTALNVYVYNRTKGRVWAHLYVPETSGLIPILLLETRGRRTGRLRITPLIFHDKDGEYVLAAANAGHSRHPAWFLNLRADPSVRVRIGEEEFSARARVTRGEERSRLFAHFAAVYPPLLRYKESTDREIPMIVLEPEDSTG